MRAKALCGQHCCKQLCRKKKVMPCWIVHASKALCRGCGLAKRTLLHTFSSVSLGNANLGDLDIKSFES
ncbi:unnamed protein product [Ilex paraguariensis]|uniref:Uncharacterized protein n=1 Tax=Ilex paraguariensis TaxID=185542 RepID=A0ABC8SG34_9AQUA